MTKATSAKLDCLRDAAWKVYNLRVDRMTADVNADGCSLDSLIDEAQDQWFLALARAIRMRRPEEWAPMCQEEAAIESIARRTLSMTGDWRRAWDNARRLYEAIENGTDLVDNLEQNWRPSEMLKRIGLPADYRPIAARPPATPSAHSRLEARVRYQAAGGAV